MMMDTWSKLASDKIYLENIVPENVVIIAFVHEVYTSQNWLKQSFHLLKITLHRLV